MGVFEEASLGVHVDDGGSNECVEWEAALEEEAMQGPTVVGPAEGGAGGEEEGEGVGVGGWELGEEADALGEGAVAGVGLEKLVEEEGGGGGEVGEGEGAEEGGGVGEVGGELEMEEFLN